MRRLIIQSTILAGLMLTVSTPCFSWEQYDRARSSLDQLYTAIEQLRNTLGVNKVFRSGSSYDAIIAKASEVYSLDPSLVKAVIQVESNFDPFAISPKKAKGLMQLMDTTAIEMGVKDPFDAFQNVMGGSRYLATQLSRYGDLRLALAAYNAGPANVNKYGGIPPFGETLAYVDRVLKYYADYRASAD